MTCRLGPIHTTSGLGRIGSGQSGTASHTGWIGRWESGGVIGQITLYQRESCQHRCRAQVPNLLLHYPLALARARAFNLRREGFYSPREVDADPLRF